MQKKKAFLLRSKRDMNTNNFVTLLSNYRNLDLLITYDGRERRALCCWVGRKDPLSVFSPPCLLTRPRKAREKYPRKKPKKHRET